MSLLDPIELRAMTPDQIGRLSPAELAGITPQQASGLAPEQLAAVGRANPTYQQSPAYQQTQKPKDDGGGEAAVEVDVIPWLDGDGPGVSVDAGQVVSNIGGNIASAVLGPVAEVALTFVLALAGLGLMVWAAIALSRRAGALQAVTGGVEKGAGFATAAATKNPAPAAAAGGSTKGA